MVVDARFKKGLELFNEGEYFECHDTLEDLWQGTRGVDRHFLQGLIQVSVGLYHMLNGNFKGAASQLRRGLEKLHPYAPAHRGIELKAFISEVTVYQHKAERGESFDQNSNDIPAILLHHV